MVHPSTLERLASCILFTASPVLGALYGDMSSLPQDKQYDYIIVGAGVGGGVLGRRLSENPNRNILVIEAGGNPDGDISNEIPYLYVNNIGGAEDWNFTVTPQPGLGGRSPLYSQGKVLGGSSTLAILVWNRGSSEVYDHWANATEEDSWSWDNMLPYFRKMEHPNVSPDGVTLDDKWTPSYHGSDGPLGVTIAPYVVDSDAKLANLSIEMPDEWPHNQDPASSGYQLGLGWAPTSIENGARATSWTHYLRPVVNRTNLDVVINTQVTRVLQTGWKDGLPEFRGVEYATDSTDGRGTINATAEVILSAGSMQTPHLLMLSGIGDKSTLATFGIDTIIDNPNVGQHLREHPILPNHWSVVDTANTVDPPRENATIMAEDIELWKANRTGRLTIAAPNHIAWARAPTDVAPFDSLEDPSPGPNAAHMEWVIEDQFLTSIPPLPATGKYFTMISGVVSPASVGNVTLNSSSPFDAPIINVNVLGEPWDVAIMREGVRRAVRAANSTSLQNDFILAPYGPLADAINAGLTDDALDRYMQVGTTVAWHASCSARMTKVNGTDGVLDPWMRVQGSAALRVVDASAFPYLPTGNPLQAVYAFAERGADVIKAQNGDGWL